MPFHNFLNLFHHFGLAFGLLAKNIDGKILVDPDPAESPLIDGNHAFLDFEGAEPVEEPLEPDD